MLNLQNIEKKLNSREAWLATIVCILLTGLAVLLLKDDSLAFLSWYLMAFLMGLAMFPITGTLFSKFKDKGWVFSKVLSIMITGFLTWFLVSVKMLPFTASACKWIVGIVTVFCWLFYLRKRKSSNFLNFSPEPALVFWEEVLFFTFFLIWTYIAGFKPAAYGTEKFMDYGFMEAMMRSTVLPARDLWYSEGTINYYYGGQYFAVFLTKLSGQKVEVTYNLMRSFIAGIAFVLPFSLVYQLAIDKYHLGEAPAKKTESSTMRKKHWIPAVSGVTAGLAVSIAGNMHYTVYAIIYPLLQKLTGKTPDTYWFPDATRYIGYRPDVPDKTIHEFPCYSFILGDLHAHVVNILFVLLIVGVLYAWMRQIRNRKAEFEINRQFWKENLLMPHILLVSVLLGMFQWTNFWDFAVYFVVTGGVVLFMNLVRFQGKIRPILYATTAQALEVLVVSFLVILPFTLTFDSMFQGIGIAQNHSLFYQLLILWGLPVSVSIFFIVTVLKRSWKKKSKLHELLASLELPDLFTIILGLCAMGLVLIPELVYIKDIYGESNARANTMFKLTYQAFILFGIVMGYAFWQLFQLYRRGSKKYFIIIALFCCFCSTLGYWGACIRGWCGTLNPSQYRGLDATAFLETDFAEDAAGIRWLKENIKDVSVVLEANGDSYSGYERVSAMTGLPTITGWYVHEWLWRNDTKDLARKNNDIECIYTSDNKENVHRLLKKYEVSYIFVGEKEREKYGKNLNEEVIKDMGKTVFHDEESETYIICCN